MAVGKERRVERRIHGIAAEHPVLIALQQPRLEFAVAPTELEKRDSRYLAFARRLYSLARNFEEEALVALLQRSLGIRSDATAD